MKLLQHFIKERRDVQELFARFLVFSAEKLKINHDFPAAYHADVGGLVGGKVKAL